MSNEIEKYNAESGSVFLAKDDFDHALRVCTMLSKSALVPITFQGKIENCMIALEMAQRIGASPLMVMQNMDIIHGKPSWRSQFLIATFNSTGRYSSIRYEKNKKNGGSIRAKATDLSNDEVLHGAWVSMTMAKAEGWLDKKGSKWKTMPELMLRYRAAAFFVRQFAPEVSMGLMTTDESHDIGSVEDAEVVIMEEKVEEGQNKKEELKNKQKKAKNPPKKDVKSGDKSVSSSKEGVQGKIDLP